MENDHEKSWIHPDKLVDYEKRAKLKDLYSITLNESPELPYHNAHHNLVVSLMAGELGYLEGLCERDIFVLMTAGALHDIVYRAGRVDNEVKSAERANEVLGKLGYSSDDIADSKRLIIATMQGYEPDDKLEMIIRDADIFNIGARTFWSYSEFLRKEKGIGKDEWHKIQVKFLRSAEFYTPSAKRLLLPRLKENLRSLEGFI